MPLINRIEISNFMNSRREDPWRPDWTYQVFDLKGDNTAINIPNGRGKSTIVFAVLALLAHDKWLHELRRIHFAPQSTGHCTHLRMETYIWASDDSPADLVVQSGGDAGGTPMVFGLYGNAGESASFKVYAYRGTLEDCPVGRKDGNRVTLTGNGVFLDKLSAMPGRFPAVQRDDTRVNWREFVAGIFDMPSIEQQLVYQKARGAEGSSGYFDVNPQRGRSFAETVFYERLAPELLVDMMGSVEEYADERGIEDVIHQKVQGIIKAKVRTAKTADDLERTRRVLTELDRIKGKADTVLDAQSDADSKVAAFAQDYSVLKSIVVDDPVPGLLRQPPDEAPMLIRSMVMQNGKWYMPDRAFELFTGEQPKHINERALRHRIENLPSERSQRIDFTCDHGWTTTERSQGGGVPTKLYILDSAIAFVNATTNFRAPFTRESTIQIVNDSFAWVQAHGDTNPARIENAQLATDLDAAENRRLALTTSRDELHAERSRLQHEQQMLDVNQAEYRRMFQSGLFSELELKTPSATGTKVEKEYKSAEGSLHHHRQVVAENKAAFADWQSFVATHGTKAEPEELASALEQANSNAKNAVEQNKNDLDNARGSLRDARSVAANGEKTYNRALEESQRAAKLRPDVAAYQRLFGDASPEGLQARVRREFDLATGQQNDVKSARSAMAEGLGALAAFSQMHDGDVAPKAWLSVRTNERSGLAAEMSRLQDDRKDLKRRIDDLDKAAVAPGRVAREVMEVAGADAVPLHAFVDSIELPLEQKERVLAMFSALLFSPVLETHDQAAAIARTLATQGIESPVFVAAELSAFLRQADIAYDGVVARTWLVGVRTRPVDCLIDPSLVDREKDVLGRQLDEIDTKLTTLQGRYDALDPESDKAVMARKAAEALDRDYPAKDSELGKQFDDVEKVLPGLRDRASEEAVNSILACIAFRQLLGSMTEEEFEAKLNVAQQAAEESKSQLQISEEAVGKLEECREVLQSALTRASLAATEITRLKSIQNFMNADGPAFMTDAPTKKEKLESAYDTAIKRRDFRFELADAFVSAGDDRAQKIQTRLSVIEPIMEDIVNTQIPAVEKDMATKRTRVGYLAGTIVEIDGFVRDLRKKYRDMVSVDGASEMGALPPQIASHPLFSAAAAARHASTTDEIAEALLAMRSPLDEIEAISLKRDVEHARDTLKTARHAFVGEIDRIKNDPTIALNEQMRIGLENAKSNVAELSRMIGATTENYGKSLAANETAREYLDTEWTEIGSWLEGFTRRLPSNFEVMKKTFRPTRDSASGDIIAAGFEVDATVADFSDVRVVLTSIIDKVEKSERNRENLGDDETLRARFNQTVRKDIREEFYRNVLLGPTIKVCIPSISRKPLKLEKGMVSSGQGVAMTLLWIVKMADYVTERELQRQNIRAAARKRVRSTRTQFVIIDGAFSHLSDKRLITDALDGVRNTNGRFQLIITGHDPNYKNDFAYFPSYIVGREIGGNLMYAESVTRRLQSPEEVGSHVGAMEVSSFHKLPVSA